MSAWASRISAAMPRMATAFINPPTRAKPGKTSVSRIRYHIGAVRVHPTNPDIVYVAALGHLFGPESSSAVSTGPRTAARPGSKIYTRGAKAGAVDLILDPRKSERDLCGLLGRASRTPWDLESGGPGSGLFKSTDGGDTWTDLSRNPGMPKGILGRIGVTVSAANSDRVWAHGRSRRRRRVPLRQRRQDLDQGQRASASCGSAPGITRASSPIR